MKRFICLVVAGIFLFGNSLTGQDQKKVYAPMPAPPRYLDSMLVSNGIMEIADRVYDNGWIDFKQSLEINPANLFEKYQKYFDFTEGNIMVLDTIIRDDKGYAYYHFHQEYQGIPLDNLDYIIQAKDGKATYGNGRFVPKLNLQQNVVINSRNVPQQASSVALTRFASEAKIMNAETVIARNSNSDPANEKTYRLAYKITAQAIDSNAMKIIKTIFVDAANNQIFKEMDHRRQYVDVCRETGTVNTLYNGSQSFKLVSYKVIYGVFPVQYYGLKYIDPNKSSPNLADYVVNVKGIPITGNGDDTHEETSNSWTSADNKMRASMLWAYEKTWDYFALYLNNRNIRNKIGIQIAGTNNTFYDTEYDIHFGRGIPGEVNPMMSLDIVAHEYTHVITALHRKLKYEGETASLVESFSDIFGAIVQRSVEGHNSSRVYMMGEDIYIPGNGQQATTNKFYLRSFATPKLYGSHPVDSWNYSYQELGQPNTYGGEFWYFGTTDNGGCHTNNSIQNHWFYLLAEGGQGTNDLGVSYNVSGIGFDKARIIFEKYYKTDNINKTLNHYDARNYSLISAKDIYGLSSNEYQQVYNAWEAVGVGTNSPNINGPDKIVYSEVYTVNNPQNKQVTWLVDGNYSLSDKTNTSVRVTRMNLTQSSGILIAVIKDLTEVRKEITSDPFILTISGSTPICSGSSKPFSASNWVSGNFYWDKSNNSINLSSPVSNATITVSAAGSTGGGSVYIKDSSGKILATYNVWVGKPSISVYAPYYVGPQISYEATLVCNNATHAQQGLNSTSDVNWTCTSNLKLLSKQINKTGFIVNKSSGVGTESATIYVTATNSCGSDNTNQKLTIQWPSPSPSPPHPNPVSDVLSIEIGSSSYSNTKSANLTFDVRLFDVQGNLLRQTSTKGGTIQFNVSNLPVGNYFLHIYDGVNSAPEIHQIVVQR